jgi:hypothetical protein
MDSREMKRWKEETGRTPVPFRVGSKSYIPEGGVWTAEEREAIRAGRWSGQPFRVIKIADETVSALVAALDREHKADSDVDGQWSGQHDGCATCALLAAVKGEK